MQIEVEGVDELMQCYDKLIKRYPDKAGQLLRKQATELTKDIMHNAQSRVSSSIPESAKSIRKRKGYRISQVQGIGVNQYVTISATSPHYHLIERGFNHTSGSHYTGKEFLADAVTKKNEHIDEYVSIMVDSLLREAGL